MATSDNKDTNNSSTSNNSKDEDNILSFGSSNSSSNKKDDIIKTDILGFPIKVDPLTLGIGGIALLGLGIAGFQWWQNTQKQQEEDTKRKQIEQQKQARYLQYLKNQEIALKNQQAQKAELLEKQRMSAESAAQQQHHTQYSGVSSYNDIGNDSVSYDDPTIHSSLSGLNLESLDIDPYHKSSRLSHMNNNYNPAPIDMGYNQQQRPNPPLLTNQRLSAYNNSSSEYIPPSQPGNQMIQANEPNEQDMLPIEFSNPSQNVPPSPPVQHHRKQNEEEEQQEQDEEVQGEYDAGLSPDELMNSINNSNYYN